MKTSPIRFYASFLLLASAIFALPRLAQAQSPTALDGRTTPVIGNPASTPAGSALATGNGPDDMNSSQLTPFGSRYVTYCPWVNQAVQAYAAANPGYTFTWDSIANPNDPFLTRLANDLSVSIYTPWVVNSPTVTGLDGNNRSRNVANQDAGGSVFQFKYTPNAGNGDPTSVRFIQAYNESFNGSGTYKVYLDRGASTTPFYDDKGVSGTAANGRQLANNVSWMQDTPLDRESQLMPLVPTAEGPNEVDTSSDVQFQAVLATVTGKNVTLYGGFWWGYNYWNSDIARQDPYNDTGTGPESDPNENEQVSIYDDPNGPNSPEAAPEPSTVVLAAFGFLGLNGLRRCKAFAFRLS